MTLSFEAYCGHFLMNLATYMNGINSLYTLIDSITIKSCTCKKSDYLSCSEAFSRLNRRSLVGYVLRMSGKYCLPSLV